MVKWSVCIPTAGEVSTSRAVSSVLNQATAFSFEVIVAGKIPDDLELSSNFHFVDTGLVPPGLARNKAFENAKGKNIAFLDSDCIAKQGWLQALDDRIESGAQLVGGTIDFPQNNYFSLSDNVACFFDQTSFLPPGFVETVASINMACTRFVFEKIGFFDSKAMAGEDLEWILKARRKGFIPYLEPKARCIHTGGRDTFLSVIKHAQVWGKHSIGIRKKYSDVLQTPSFFFNSTLLSFLSPAIGAAFATQIILTRGMLRYAHTWPVIAAAKTAWCLSAASYL